MNFLNEMENDLSTPETGDMLQRLKIQFGMIDGEVALFSHTTEQAQGSSAIHKAEFYSNKNFSPSPSEFEVSKNLVKRL